MSKFTDPIHEPPPDPKDVARENAKRRRRDNVEQLPSGFTFRASGRHGFVYYREGDHILELCWEMSGREDREIILSLRGLREWALPRVEPVDAAKQKQIEDELRKWLELNNVRSTFAE